MFVIADDGASEWVSPDVAEKFKKEGSKLLGGAVEAEDTGREELEEENEKLKKTIESTRLSEQQDTTIPSISDWSVDQLADWLVEKFKLEDVAATIREEEVDGAEAVECGKEAWKEMGASYLKAAKIVTAIKKML